MRFLAKCVLFICLGIPKSVEHNSEGKKILPGKTDGGGGAREAPPPLRQQRVRATIIDYNS
jgi:hypothetical protein